MADERNPLAEGSQIDCYEIIKPIAGGGFSLIYLAKDLDDQSRVVIKEYLPKKLSQRNQDSALVQIVSEDKRHSFNQGRKLFYKEAKVLSQLKHPNIVNVRNFFLANDTAYMVMDYEEGKNLGGYIRKRGGSLSTRFMMTVFPPILDALALIHEKNHLHLDIKPSNIHLRSGGNPLLLDFGAAHEFLEQTQVRSGRVVTPGYSPMEQYYSTGALGPWSDVYAIGASMRTCLDGKSPPTAIERHAKDNLKPALEEYGQRYPKAMLEAIDWAMAIDAPDRPQDARELLQALLAVE
ncbi:MAG: serine/threonine protein kinase [Gammaproteobacteria bacterium SHHR-1]|uniref:serine/threonine protein kinase n=1 Tax=Magnetovirga frankeli TaxID=947516 RepID=UPI0012937760|nr:serine/threonine protein kinase [gamma proteobacterium SS-5]